jgi:DNA-binding SARP family transcriptional activator/tetratricopeptide (TPR) repeat protein
VNIIRITCFSGESHSSRRKFHSNFSGFRADGARQHPIIAESKAEWRFAESNAFRGPMACEAQRNISFMSEKSWLAHRATQRARAFFADFARLHITELQIVRMLAACGYETIRQTENKISAVLSGYGKIRQSSLSVFMENRAGLSIKVLGKLQVTYLGEPRKLPASRRTRGLLAYLALRGRPFQRDELCDLLWDGSAHPRRELRWSLSKIKAAVGDWLEVTPDGIGLATEGLTVDAIAVRKLLLNPLSEERVREALALWRGAPLEDVEVGGQRAFQAWVAEEREVLMRVRSSLLKAAVDLAWACPETALSAARRFVAAQPWNQWGHARVVQLLERCGRPGEAADYAKTTSQRLAQELGIENIKLIAAPPDPSDVSVNASLRKSRKVMRHRIKLEPLKLVPRDDVAAAFGLRVSATLGSGLWRHGSCTVIDGDTSSRYDACAMPAEFSVLGAVAQEKGATRVSLRCRDARCGAVIWLGQIAIDAGGLSRLDEWLRGAVKAIVDAVEACANKLGDTADCPNAIDTAWTLATKLDPISNRQALTRLDEILSTDPGEPAALALAAWCHAQRVVYNWSDNPAADRAEADYYARAATRLAANDPKCLTAIATARMQIGDPGGAAPLLQRALELDPRAPDCRTRSGWLANFNDDPRAAARHFRAAVKLAPWDPNSFNALAGWGTAHFIEGNYVQAIRRMEQALALNPHATWIYRNLVPAYSAAAERRKAEEGVSLLVQSYPNLTVGDVTAAIIFSPAVLRKFAEGLSHAGLPR